MEHDALLSRASVSGLSLSEYLRLAGLHRPLPATVRAPVVAGASFELVEQLRRVGVNLNQLTRLSHIDAVHHAELASTLDDLRGVLALLMPPAGAGDTEH
ncbi:plasmid mobilization relaxosome protein MobC [Caballeronia grimmiae]